MRRAIWTVLMALLACPADAGDLTGHARVTEDGSLSIGETQVRLWSIDAFETDQICHRFDGTVWQCGVMARMALAGSRSFRFR